MVYQYKNPKLTEREKLIESLNDSIEYGEITKEKANEHLRWYDDNIDSICV